MTKPRQFTKPFTQQEPISDEGIQAAIAVMQSGRLHRYNTLDGEYSEVDLFEQEFARYLGVPYSLACSSGGYALHIALRAAGLRPGEPVLCNSFTLAPVPGAIHNAGGKVVLVEIDDSLCIDLVDLEKKARESQARFLMLSHMRGHLIDMDAISTFCRAQGIVLIEDCAHTMGASWNGQASGSFGDIACFSTQTYKHINSGEGGILTTRDPNVIARAILLSGSYMLYDRHSLRPKLEDFGDIPFDTPNYSGRMDNLRASILRPQLRQLDVLCERWNGLYRCLEEKLRQNTALQLITRPQQEHFVGSSFQFLIPSFSESQMSLFVGQCEVRGVSLKWFGDAAPKAYTSRFDSWRYLDSDYSLPQTARILSTLIDMRLPLTFDFNDIETIAEIINEVIHECQ